MRLIRHVTETFAQHFWLGQGDELSGYEVLEQRKCKAPYISRVIRTGEGIRYGSIIRTYFTSSGQSSLGRQLVDAPVSDTREVMFVPLSASAAQSLDAL